MDADTWAAFEETGDPFDRAVADRFRTISCRPATRPIAPKPTAQFRGRDPDVNALLKRRGFPVDGGTGKAERGK